MRRTVSLLRSHRRTFLILFSIWPTERIHSVQETTNRWGTPTPVFLTSKHLDRSKTELWFVPSVGRIITDHIGSKSKNKKALLRERKRHTARKRAQDANPPSPAWTDTPPPPAGLTLPPWWLDWTPLPGWPDPPWLTWPPPAGLTWLPPPQAGLTWPPAHMNRLKTLPSPILRMRAVIMFLSVSLSKQGSGIK